MPAESAAPSADVVLPRRTATAGLAGALATLGLVGRSGSTKVQAKQKKAKKKQAAGRVRRFTYVEGAPVTIGPGLTRAAFAQCDPPHAQEKVFALSGGFRVSSRRVVVTSFGLADDPANAWFVQGENTDAVIDQTITARVTCLYVTK